jgi:hypothetical protein
LGFGLGEYGRTFTGVGFESINQLPDVGNDRVFRSGIFISARQKRQRVFRDIIL